MSLRTIIFLLTSYFFFALLLSLFFYASLSRFYSFSTSLCCALSFKLSYTYARSDTSIVYRATFSKLVFALVAMRFLRFVALRAMAYTSRAWLVARNDADSCIAVLRLEPIHSVSEYLLVRRCLVKLCDSRPVTRPRNRLSRTDAVLPSSCSFESISRPSSSASPVHLDQD